MGLPVFISASVPLLLTLTLTKANTRGQEVPVCLCLSRPFDLRLFSSEDFS